jgi:hypothetical protein
MYITYISSTNATGNASTTSAPKTKGSVFFVGYFYLENAETIEKYSASGSKSNVKTKEKFIEDIKRNHKYYKNVPEKDKGTLLETPILVSEKFDGKAISLVCGPNSWLAVTCKLLP